VSNCEQAHPEQASILASLGIPTKILGAAQVFVVSLAWTLPKRNDRQAGHAFPIPVGRFLKESLAGVHVNVEAIEEESSEAAHEGRS